MVGFKRNKHIIKMELQGFSSNYAVDTLKKKILNCDFSQNKKPKETASTLFTTIVTEKINYLNKKMQDGRKKHDKWLQDGSSWSK